MIWRQRVERNSAVKNDEQFRKWLGETFNKAAWETVGRLWEVFDHHRDTPEFLNLRAGAWKRAHAAPSPRRTRVLYYALGAVSLAIIIAPAVMRFFPTAKPITYSTEVGQRRTITLADGSHIALDSLSSVTVSQMSARARNLVLNKGRAHFDVAHDSSRPFRVRVGKQLVVAVGTAFNVERLEAKIFVTLTQGRVKVESGRTVDSAPDKAFVLNPGQELVVNQAGAAAVTQIDLRAANAWEHGQIVLNNEPLADVAEQLNRYLPRPILVDPAIANMRINGVLNVGQLNSFVGALTSYFPIQSRPQNGHILLEKRT